MYLHETILYNRPTFQCKNIRNPNGFSLNKLLINASNIVTNIKNHYYYHVFFLSCYKMLKRKKYDSVIPEQGIRSSLIYKTFY